MKAKTDEVTLKLLAEIEKQKVEIASAEKPNWSTPCSFRNTDGTTYNLHVEANVGTLIGLYARVSEEERAYKEAAEDLGLKEYPEFRFSGSSAKDWK